MDLKLNRPLVFFDIESTGLNIVSDAIVELSFVKVFPDGEQRVKTWRMCPWDYQNNCQLPMNPAAQAVNGISDEDVKDEKKFYELFGEIISWLSDADLAGYNSAKFDLPMLAEEIERARRFKGLDPGIDLHKKKMIDVQVIFHKMEPRNLKAAHRFYVGCDFENAHAAEADTLATYAVLKGQLNMYTEEQIKNDVEWLDKFTRQQNVVDYAGRLVLNDKGEPCVNFGKHKGKTAREVYMSEPSYFAWIDNGDFTLDTKQQFAALKAQYDAEKKQMRSRPLSDKQTMDAAQQLKNHFGSNGKLF